MRRGFCGPLPPKRAAPICWRRRCSNVSTSRASKSTNRSATGSVVHGMRLGDDHEKIERVEVLRRLLPAMFWHRHCQGNPIIGVVGLIVSGDGNCAGGRTVINRVNRDWVETGCRVPVKVDSHRLLRRSDSDRHARGSAAATSRLDV
jgi:hypothetical protein